MTQRDRDCVKEGTPYSFRDRLYPVYTKTAIAGMNGGMV